MMDSSISSKSYLITATTVPGEQFHKIAKTEIHGLNFFGLSPQQ